MKAVVLWQPWATAMALGLKLNETRGWPTSHRGELAICAAKRRPAYDGSGYPDFSLTVARMLWAERRRITDEPLSNFHGLVAALPYGKVVCVVRVTGCVPTRMFGPDGDRRLSPREFELGDYSMGRYAWTTAELRRLPRPVGVVGHQGLFELPPDVEAAVRSQQI